ncbi:MAG TPA: CusA/CzcA family heavy metal efflux RND transporter [Chthoniobacterales bacterium]|nr:CusA/CzcA family heavy metal efflux RND transporter [Chthoniobacterales bacterium]
MIERLIDFSIRRRWLVLVGVLGIAVLGFWNYARLTIDAVPDISNVQVQINTAAPGFSPLETEQRITFPVETAMAGLPHLDFTRSLSRYGLSQVTVIFKDGTDIYFARQLINERLATIKDQLPPGATTEMGPISTALGEVYMWSVEAEPGAQNEQGQPYSSTDLRTIQEWIIKPQLRNVPGIIEINSIGGYEKQYDVTPRPDRLISYGLSFRGVMNALQRNNANVSAGYIERNGEQYLIRVPGQVQSIEDIEQIVVGGGDGVPIRIRDVADVAIGKELRTGAATLNGKETVVGVAMMLMGENSRVVADRVDAAMKEIKRSLPKGVVARTLYSRSGLVNATIDTVKKNLLEGALLVAAILFALLGNWRAALITTCVIPLSMLFAITGMVTNKVSASLMSLGALDFGLIVDGAVIIVENCIRRLTNEQEKLRRRLGHEERLQIVREAAKEVITPSIFGAIIIMVVYLPILTLGGVEGKMFVPMALTVLFALIGAMIFSLTFIPAAISLWLGNKLTEQESFVIRAAKRFYLPLLDRSLQRRTLVLSGAIIALTISFAIFTRLGGEFIPILDEGDLALEIYRVVGTGMDEAVKMQKPFEEALISLPEVKLAFGRLGTAEVATDPMSPNQGDEYVILKPRKEWPHPKKPKAQLIEDVDTAVKQVVGTGVEIEQPIQLRANELIAGVKSDMAVKVFGDDIDVLKNTAEKIRAVLARIPGSVAPKVQQVDGLPMLTIQLKRDMLARYGLSVGEVQDVIEMAIGGKAAGEVFEGDRRFPLVVRLPENLRTDLEALRRIPLALPKNEHANAALNLISSPPFIPLGEVADLQMAQVPNEIGRENGKRVVVVTSNVRGRDLSSFVADAQRAVRDKVQVPAGYWLGWGGQFEQLQSATRRLEIVVPLALALIFVLLFAAFGNIKDSLLVYTGVPLALTGGILALWLRGLPFSISAGVGFIALSGVAVLNGVVMVSFIARLRESGRSLDDAIRLGSFTRLRPVLMTALVASLGFLPMALAHGRGAEVQRPLATVVIGGIISSTALTLIVLPVLYRIFHRKELSRYLGELPRAPVGEQQEEELPAISTIG